MDGGIDECSSTNFKFCGKLGLLPSGEAVAPCLEQQKWGPEISKPGTWSLRI